MTAAVVVVAAVAPAAGVVAPPVVWSFAFCDVCRLVTGGGFVASIIVRIRRCADCVRVGESKD